MDGWRLGPYTALERESMNEDKRAATGTRSGIRCAGCGAPFLRRRELVLAVNWFIRLRTYCPACFDETQHKGGWEKLLRTNCRISRFWVLIGLLPFVSA